jgi:hypothetical protein
LHAAPGYTALEGVSLSSFGSFQFPVTDRNLQLLGFLGLCLRYSDGQHPMLVEGMDLIRIYCVGQP